MDFDDLIRQPESPKMGTLSFSCFGPIVVNSLMAAFSDTQIFSVFLVCIHVVSVLLWLMIFGKRWVVYEYMMELWRETVIASYACKVRPNPTIKSNIRLATILLQTSSGYASTAPSGYASYRIKLNISLRSFSKGK